MFLGEFRGSAHNQCNLNYKNSLNIPIFFHNMSNYDIHLIIKEIVNGIPGECSLISQNLEKYTVVIKRVGNLGIRFTFLDSYKFLNSSLDKLASYLPNDKKKNFTKTFPNRFSIRFTYRKGLLSL